jgi:serine/threonine protein kinase
VCVVVAVLVYRKCARSRADTLASSRHDASNKYHDASTLDVGGSSGGATVRSGSASLFAPQEYLSNDIRNDEALITYRIAYEEVQFLQEIAKGGYGIIYLGRFRGRHVAIKRMLPEKAKDTRIVRSFMDEIRLCASLEHPRIVEFIGISWSTLQDMAVVIEYMGGGDLHALLRGREAESLPVEWFEASQCLKPKSSLALDIVDGLVYLHSFDHAIIHRDLKARNVLLNDEGDAKLSDFGISREATLDETMTGEIGTVAWIAPEVLRGERYSEKADIYSLGVLLVELDTARHPYRRELSETSGTPQSNTQIALLVSSGKLAPSLTEECPADVAALVASCLSFDPHSRPSAMDVHYELQKILQQHRRG